MASVYRYNFVSPIDDSKIENKENTELHEIWNKPSKVKYVDKNCTVPLRTIFLPT